MLCRKGQETRETWEAVEGENNINVELKDQPCSFVLS